MEPEKIQQLHAQLNREEQFLKNIQKHEDFWSYREELFRRAATLNRRLIEFVGIKKYHEMLEGKLEEFVEFIESQTDIFNRRDLLHWFAVPVYKYRIWKSRVEYHCQSSLGHLCARQHPSQLNISEYRLIEKAVKDERFLRWPKTAIHSLLLRARKLRVSRSTFYKYAARFLPQTRKKKWKPPYRPIRASRPDAFWHVDISVFFTLDEQRCLIYALIDNYSRKILSWRCSTGNASKRVVGEMLLESLELRRPKNLTLVTDGGPENVNRYMRKLVFDYCSIKGQRLKHEVALGTIRKSNSMIERFFHIMKYDYLYRQKPADPYELKYVLERMIYEYNHIRPHYSLDHRTPDEAYRGIPPMDFRKDLSKGRKQRIEKNRNCDCQICLLDCH